MGKAVEDEVAPVLVAPFLLVWEVGKAVEDEVAPVLRSVSSEFPRAIDSRREISPFENLGVGSFRSGIGIAHEVGFDGSACNHILFSSPILEDQECP